MGRPFAVQLVNDGLQALENALHNYYGAMNEIRAGLKPESPPEKPEALIRLEQCEVLGIPLLDGGLVNQPHIWLQELAVVIETRSLFEKLASLQDQ